MTKRRSRLIGWLSGLTVVVLVAGCGSSDNPGGPEVGPTATSAPSSVGAPSSGVAAPSSTAAERQRHWHLGSLNRCAPMSPGERLGHHLQPQAALASLGADLLTQLPAADNAVLSPYSIYAVLAMARAGRERRDGHSIGRRTRWRCGSADGQRHRHRPGGRRSVGGREATGGCRSRHHRHQAGQC